MGDFGHRVVEVRTISATSTAMSCGPLVPVSTVSAIVSPYQLNS